MSFAGIEPTDPGQNSGFDYSDIGAGDRSGAAKLPFVESLADTASHAFFGATREVGSYIEMQNAIDLKNRDRQFNVDPTQDPGGALIDPKEYQAKYQDLGLTFTPDMGRAQADLLVAHKQDELRRQYVLDHSPDTFMAKTARTLTDFAVSALDPVNVAAAFVPGVGETRAGLIAAKYGKTFGRIAEGAVAGATGMAALQPLQYAEAAAYQDHYGPMDAFMNVAFGAALGGGLHAGVGVFSDFLGRASPETREAALRASVGQAVEGRPVDVEPVLGTDPGLVSEPAPEQAATGFQTAKGSTYELHDDGTTTRDKAARTDPGHEGQQGLQPRSEATYFVTKEHADELGLFQTEGGAGKALVERPDGTIGIRYTDGPNAGKFERRTVAKPADGPAAGLVPIETWNQGTRVHFGNDITGVSRPEAVPSRTADTINPASHSAIARARQNSLDFAQGREPSTVAARPEVQAHADEVIKTGDDPKTELADAQARLTDYKAQGILTDSEHTAFTDANAADDEAHKTRADAADAAARCLFLHP